MRVARLLFITLIIAAIAHPAFAATSSLYNISWSALNPGNDWSAQVLRSLFPISGNTPGPNDGSEATVIGGLVGQFTGFIAAIAAAFVAYSVIVNIHRAAETSRILGSGQTWMSVVRIGFAAIMMFPLSGGFSAGQEMVFRGAMWGIGMAKVLYTNAIQAIGPDAHVIAAPMIPGTGNIVSALIDSEMCMNLVNLAAGREINENTGAVLPTGNWLVQPPQGITTPNDSGGKFVSWRYSMGAGNGSANPVCGSVTIKEGSANEATIAGLDVDMSAVQQAVLTDVIQGYIREPVEQVAQNLWQTKDAVALLPLQGIYTNAVNYYQSTLTNRASQEQAKINRAIQANAAQARNGNLDLLQSEQQQSALGWTSAAAYYLEIDRLNADTLSLMSALPIVTSPTYEGIGSAISYDLAPLESATNAFMGKLQTVALTQDGTQPPSGTPSTLASTENDARGSSVLTRVFRALNLSHAAMDGIINYMLPTNQIWTDPFGGLLALGQILINTSLIGFGTAALLSSTTTSAGMAIWHALTFNWGAAVATVAGHVLMQFLAVPIFALLVALMIPGILLAYVLPMIPYILWMAGILGWLILVCEAMIAVPLWMLASMTIGGDGLHGRATEGWGLLFNVMFRPALMVIGLFLSYFLFACMSWLVREGFPIVTGFALSGGWIVANWIGAVVFLNIFVMLLIILAISAFRMIALLPHHLPRLLGFSPASRIDHEAFYYRSGWSPGMQLGYGAFQAIGQGSHAAGRSAARLQGEPAGYISTSDGGGGTPQDDMDSTLRATTDPGNGSGEDV